MQISLNCKPMPDERSKIVAGGLGQYAGPGRKTAPWVAWQAED